MKLIQSFWGKPLLDELPNRSTAGWPERKYCYMSQALSCLQLRQFHSRTELITDTIGRKLLVEQIGLPYDKVSTDLDILSLLPGDLWPIKNLYAYSIQSTPFIHIDGDIYLDSPLDTDQFAENLLVENQLHIHSQPLRLILSQIIQKMTDSPDYLRLPDSSLLTIFNPGIFGGTDIRFINGFAQEALTLIAKNLAIITDNLGIDIGDFNQGEFRILDLFGILFQSYLLTAAAEKQNKTMEKILPDVEIEMAGNSFNTMTTPDISHFHPLYNEKRRTVVCWQVENKLRRNHPDYYYKIKSLLDDYTL